jgi:hypothetical protein
MNCIRFILVAAVAPVLVLAASSGSGLITGQVLTDQGQPVADALITLENKVTGHRQIAHSDSRGRFSLFNVPFNDYHLEAKAPGLSTSHRNVAVHSNLPIALTLTMPVTGAVVVVEDTGNLIESHPSSHIDIDHTTIEEIPAVVQSRGMESIVLQTPGVIQDENGRFHFRGSHGQAMYVIDGVPVTDQVQATFSNSLDPSQVEGMEITTGGISAEYGGKPGMVINLTSKSGLGTPDGFEGNFNVGAARFRTSEEGVAVRGCTPGGFGYFVTVAGSSSDRFLDPVNFQNDHNQGDTGRIFSRFDQILTETDTLRFSVSAGTTARDVVNLASQEAAGMNQRIHNGDSNVSIGWIHLINANSSVDTNLYYRHASARLDPTQGLGAGFQEGQPDTPFWVWQNRTLGNQGLTVTYQVKQGDDSLKAGIQGVRYPIEEHFAFAITNLAQAQIQTGNPIGPGDPIYAYTAAGGGNIFHFDDQLAPSLISGFIQDDIKRGDATFGLGLRFDSYHGADYTKNQLQPRLGATYLFTASGTQLRSSYDHLMITPENENLGFSTSNQAWALTGAGGTAPKLMPEIQDSYLLGVDQQLGSLFKASLDYWWKASRDTADNDQFMNTGLLFPIAAWKGRFHGTDLRVDLVETHGFSGYFSAGTVRTIFYSPTVGGLTSADPLINGPAGTPYLIDHDQKLTMQLGAHYKYQGFHVQVIGRYDSGLEAGDPTAAGVAGNPDYAFGIPFVHLNNDSLVGPNWRVNPRTVWNLSLGQKFNTGAKSSIEAGADLLNVFNEVALYNFLSTFGGTHVVAPRTLAVHLKYNF